MIIATALSLLNPFPVFGLEEMELEPHSEGAETEVNKLSDDQRNNTEVSISFYDKNLEIEVEPITKKWKDWFKLSDSISDYLSPSTINLEGVENLPEDVIIDDGPFKYSFYDLLNDFVIQVSLPSYSLDQAKIKEYVDNDGNYQARLLFYNTYLSSDKYEVSYSFNEQGKKIAHFTGKGPLAGSTRIYEFNELSYAIQFGETIGGWWTPRFTSPLEKEATSAVVSDYLKKIKEINFNNQSYIYSYKPWNFSQDNFFFDEDSGYLVGFIGIMPKPNDFLWQPDEEAKILVPYKEDISLGTLAFSKQDLNANTLSVETINNKLLGYSVESPIELSDANCEVIGYLGDDRKTYYALEYQLNNPIIVKKSESNPSSSEAKILIGDLKVEISLAELKNGSSFTLTADNLKTALEKTIQTLAQATIQASSNSGLNQALPNYKIVIKNIEKQLTSTSFDLSEELPSPSIQITVKPESYIRLRFNKTSTAQMGLVTQEMEESKENAQANQALIVKVSEVSDEKGNVTSESLKNYATKNGIEFNESFFKQIDLSQPQDISMINPKTGYIEIDVPVTKIPILDQGNHNVTVRPTKKPKPQKPVTPEEPMTPSSVSSKGKKKMFRLFNTVTGEHFYTSSEAEKNGLLAQGAWSDEGQGWVAPESSNYPVYRVFNPNSGEHHYTPSENEYKTLVSLGWNDEGIGWFSADDMDNKITLYRLYNPTAPEHAKHHYTVSAQERDHLLSTGEWNDEGVAWYGMPQE